ncbi:MAG: hypothetical protein QNL68_12020 [Akkermansiaceae bacterium]|jgi:chromosome segregation ATPase
MANTFGILAALVLAFAAFVAYKNKEEHQTQIDATKTEQVKRERNTNTFNTLLDDTKGLREESVVTNGARDDFNAKLKLQNDENKAAEEAITTKEAELKETKERVAEAKDKLAELGDLQGLAAKIEALKSSVDQLEDEVAVLKAQNSQLRGNKASTAERSAAVSKVLSDRNSGRSLPTLKTSVANLSDTLGFVTLAAGDNAGVVSGSKLDVKRGSETIAQLTVTAVSENTATADIISSSLKAGESVSVGDSVVASEEGAR